MKSKTQKRMEAAARLEIAPGGDAINTDDRKRAARGLPARSHAELTEARRAEAKRLRSL